MYRISKYLLIKACCLLLAFPLLAKENVGTAGLNPNSGSDQGKTEEDCNPASAFTELNINNVRAGLLNGGDIWWNLTDAQYEVPKVDPESGEPSRHSLFAGALWIGGIDNLGQLKVAAQTYRQTGNDFFPGPLDENGRIDESICANYDRFFEVRGADIDILVAALEAGGGLVSPADVPESILQWPGRDNPFFTEFALPPGKNLAPYWESGVSDGYDPTTGDLPVIDSRISEPVFADQMIWWVFNDIGNVHTESGGAAIGLEVKAMAFAFSTNDCINDMSFYRYVVTNTSTAVLDSVYFGQWVDPDLGTFDDDYVGCVIDESLGVVYNGDALDEGTNGYGTDIPLLGVDFFEGPKVDLNRDGDVLDEGEELGMSSFVYYNNDFTAQGNPTTSDHFYGYLAGVWKDKTPFTWGGTGFGGTDPTPFMFPSDPSVPPGDDVWSECAEGNPPADRRFLQVSGPFELEPGAVNNVIVGVVWVREGVQHPCPSFESLIECDQKAQALFDNNFRTLRGPDAPTMCVRELDQELILSIFNERTSNNFNEEYAEADPILRTQGIEDSTYRFQGYRIFQLANPNVSPAQFGDIDVAREIFTVDIANDDVTTLVNWFPVSGLGVVADAPVVEVIANDSGIQHTFNIKEDQFALGDKTLINHRRYFFSVIAYGFNNYNDYNPLAPDEGQAITYLAGARNIQTYTAIPHIPTPQSGGIVLNSEYGSSPDITQISGEGNGGFELELTEESLRTILAEGSIEEPIYQGGSTPVKVQVYDPFFVPEDTYVLRLNNIVYDIVEQPQNGTLTLNADGSVNYVPNSGFAGVDYFIYDIEDANGVSDLAIVRLCVGDINFGADIFALPLSVREDDDIITIDVTPGVKVQDGFPWEIVELGNAFNGEVAIVDGEIEYTPDEGFAGQDLFTYTVENAAGNESTSTVYVFIPSVTNDPEILDDDYAVPAAGGFALEPLDNDEILCDVAANELCNNTSSIVSSLLSTRSRWTLTAESTGVVYRSTTSIELANEQAIGGWVYDPNCVSNTEINCDEVARPLGFTVTVNQVDRPFKNPAFLSNSFEFTDPTNQWLEGIMDQDGEFRPDDWIRSGTVAGDYPTDREQFYENIGDPGVAPYALTRRLADAGEGTFTADGLLPMQPACHDCGGTPNNNINELHSIDIVITPDQSQWSQCLVVEMNKFNPAADKNSLRTSASLDINGNAIPGETGRSYFPGYAINLETGQRMNIMFAENTRLAGENGADMMWNPTSTMFTQQGGGGINGFRMGGEHYIYIMDTQYDGGAAHMAMFEAGNKADVYDDALWVVAPLLADGFEAEDTYRSMAEGLVPSELKISTRMALPYQRTSIEEPPTYRFNTGSFAPVTNDLETASSALDLVNVVPNPYYAFSQYENTKFDNTIKITNLPDRADINIYSLDGTWINTLRIDNSGGVAGTSLAKETGTTENALEWDLRNFQNVPVASGMYLIHVSAPDLGEEKILRWFGVMRPIDLDNF